MKTAFFGTSDKATPLLESLKVCSDLVLCVTKKDTLVGRHQEVRETEVKKWAKANSVHFIEIDSLKKQSELVVSALKSRGVELAVVADFSFIIPQEVLDEVPRGLINVHFSLLPKWRGASPVQFTILKGDDITGVTFYLIDSGMDTGKILAQYEYPLLGNETSELLYLELFELASKKLPQVIKDYYEGQTEPIVQTENDASYTYSITKPKSTLVDKNDAKIIWNGDVTTIERIIRAYYPWPVAWTTLGEMEKSAKIEGMSGLKPKVNRNLRVKVMSAEVKNGKLKINKLQIEGKSLIDWESFKNGYID